MRRLLCAFKSHYSSTLKGQLLNVFDMVTLVPQGPAQDLAISPKLSFNAGHIDDIDKGWKDFINQRGGLGQSLLRIWIQLFIIQFGQPQSGKLP